MNPRERRSGFLERHQPRVPKRYLLLVAAFAWTIAGGMLLGRGSAWLLEHGDHLFLRYAVALAGGLVFFFLLFSRISLKHVRRILAIDRARPSLFSFFDAKAYIMMAFMIGGGVLLRTSNVVAPSILYTFYACMGTPLLISALRFYHSFAVYKE
jgi:hypothetical protein